MSTQGPQPTEEEMRAALEQEMRRLRVDDVVLQTVVSLINLGARRAGLAPGAEAERDLDQVRTAIEAVRALMPLVEQIAPAEVPAIRDALSQLQLAYVRAGGQAEGEAAPGEATPADASAGDAPPADPGAPESATPAEAGPAQRSGRLWIPGQ
jgi:hypothetical protein